MPVPPFSTVAVETAPTLDRVALAIAQAFRAVDTASVLQQLDALAAEVAAEGIGLTRDEHAHALVEVLAHRHGFTGDRSAVWPPEASLIDIVLERRRGLPILLSTVYVEVARRVGIRLRGIALPGHFVVGDLDEPAILLDPFAGGTHLDPATLRGPVVAQPVHETALRMLTNLVAAYEAARDPGNALAAARMRTLLPVDPALRSGLDMAARRLAARFN